jgi:hypothetical protein
VLWSCRNSKQEDFIQWLLNYIVAIITDLMTDIAKKIKNTFQDSEAKMKTEEDHAEGKPSSETLNKAKVKTRDALE